MSARMLSLQTVFVRLVWIGFALHITGLLVPLLDILRDITFPVGGSTISLLQVVQAILVFSIMITLALWFGATIERQVMRTQSLDNNAKAIAIKLLKGSVLFFAVILTLPMVGIDSTFLSVLGGTLGVGLGFGLQKIASNYVSGFIILADRSVRLGDIITIDGKQGEVLKLEARCTTLKGGDGTLYVLPNETFMTQSLINHTQGGGGLYRTAKLQVLYGTDFAKVKALVEGVTKKQPQIMPVPEPALQLTQLGPHGLELLLEYWISDAKLPENQIRSQLLTGIYSTLSESGIQMVVVDPVRGSTPLP
jgi:small-conductance mechanosensitive channel